MHPAPVPSTADEDGFLSAVKNDESALLQLDAATVGGVLREALSRSRGSLVHPVVLRAGVLQSGITSVI